jgi:hypothetical protein
MRNLNGRFLILVDEGSFEWAEAATFGAFVDGWGASRAASNDRPGTSRKGAIFMPEVVQALGDCPLCFLGFDVGELACSVF